MNGTQICGPVHLPVERLYQLYFGPVSALKSDEKPGQPGANSFD